MIAATVVPMAAMPAVKRRHRAVRAHYEPRMQRACFIIALYGQGLAVGRQRAVATPGFDQHLSGDVGKYETAAIGFGDLARHGDNGFAEKWLRQSRKARDAYRLGWCHGYHRGSRAHGGSTKAAANCKQRCSAKHGGGASAESFG